jgi:hypothetical protein
MIPMNECASGCTVARGVATTAMKFSRFYIPLNLLFIMTVLVGAAAGATPRVVHLVVLFACCSLPLLWWRRLNDRYGLLAIFMAFYFVFYGLADYLACIGLSDFPTLATGAISSAEVLIDVCGVIFVLAYHGGVLLGDAGRGGGEAEEARDWSPRAILVSGLLLWAIGSFSIVYLNIFVSPDKSLVTTAQNFARLGPLFTGLLMLGNYLPSLGIVTLAYGYATNRAKFWLPLVIAMLFAQVLLGLLADIKGIAMSAGLLVVLAKMLVDGRLPWRWIGGAVVAAVLIYPVLTAYRGVLSERDTTRQEAAQDFGKYVQEALQARKRLNTGRQGERSATIFERMNVKPSVNTIVDHAGRDVELQRGGTLVPLLGVFIPRMIWPTKPDFQVGIQFNKQFHMDAGEDTWISPSHLGELYWNFGWVGGCIGIAVIGLLFGVVGRRCELSETRSISRVLALLSTILLLGQGFEGSVAVQYAVWLRTILVILLLHLLLARKRSLHADAGGAAVQQRDISTAPLRPAFPNLLR